MLLIVLKKKKVQNKMEQWWIFQSMVGTIHANGKVRYFWCFLIIIDFFKKTEDVKHLEF